MAAPSISELSFELRREDDELRQLFRALLSPADIADLLEVPYYYLVRILYLSPHRYQYDDFTIPKRSGGTRLICAPPPAILALQTKLNRILRLVYKPRASTHGFVENRSILTNAQSHTSKRFVLNLDLSDFFPSINFGRIRGLFLAKPYLLPEDAATLIAQICSHNGSLPQGAPTSPVISNMICWKLDRELEKLAHYNKCTYTRYADDITFSTSMKRFPANIATPTLQDWTERGVSLGEPLAQIASS